MWSSWDYTQPFQRNSPWTLHTGMWIPDPPLGRWFNVTVEYWGMYSQEELFITVIPISRHRARLSLVWPGCCEITRNSLVLVKPNSYQSPVISLVLDRVIPQHWEILSTPTRRQWATLDNHKQPPLGGSKRSSEI
jgi:hypothetical protein